MPSLVDTLASVHHCAQELDVKLVATTNLVIPLSVTDPSHFENCWFLISNHLNF